MLSYDDSGNKRKQPATLRHKDREKQAAQTSENRRITTRKN